MRDSTGYAEGLIPMRLLLVSTVAGTLRAFLLPLANHFRAMGWTVDGAANGISKSAECREAFDRTWEIDWSRRPTDPRNFLEAVGAIRRLVQREGYDIVHVHTPVAAFVTRYALRGIRGHQGKPKVIYTAHGFHFYRGGPVLRNMSFLGLELLAGRWTDHLIVINREDEEAAKHYHIVPPARLHYMPGIGVDTQRYSPATVSPAEVQQIRRELGLAEQDRLLSMVAEFNPGKRHRDAIQAFASLHRPDVHMAFAGVGPLMDDMRQMAKTLGVDRQVHFLGFRKDVPALVRASIATLLPSEREGLARSVMESLCLGVPVIGADTRGIRDLLHDGAGLLVGVGKPDELAKAMEWILQHPEEAKAMGERGRQQMTAYDIKNILVLHEQLYKDAVSE